LPGRELPVRHALPIVHTLYQVFNPTDFHAEEWVRLMERGGMKYFVFTTKHHDGFCMFHIESKVEGFRRIGLTYNDNRLLASLPPSWHRFCALEHDFFRKPLVFSASSIRCGSRLTSTPLETFVPAGLAFAQNGKGGVYPAM
jgi:hypothetical protein